MSSRIITFELNEVPYRVIDAFIEAHPESTFARVLPRSASLTSVCPYTRQLHPKISWQTFHRGVPDTRHGFVEYNQTESQGKLAYPPVWEILRNQGLRIGIGASIGAYPMPSVRENIDFYLAEPFADDDRAWPGYLSVFQRFNTAAVAHSSRNVRSGGTRLEMALQLLLNVPRLGIRASTCMRVLQQRLAERRDKVRIVRRRTIQALMSFDVCLRQIQRHKPDFSTIFVNHVAAAMHRYWAARFPDDYDVNHMPESWRATYHDEIDMAMQTADEMLGRLLAFAEANAGYRVLVLGSMGQHAIEHLVIKNQLTIQDFHAFMKLLGFAAEDYQRVAGMEPEYVVKFPTEELCRRSNEVVRNLDIEGQTPHVKDVPGYMPPLSMHW